jgi:hypothetical protein
MVAVVPSTIGVVWTSPGRGMYARMRLADAVAGVVALGLPVGDDPRLRC